MTESAKLSGAKPRLYQTPSSYYSMIARLALAEGGIAHERIFVDIHFRLGQQQPDYVRINPGMTVPTLVQADRILDQSRDIAEYAQARRFPIIPCTLCGSQENLQRLQVGNMLREWQKKHPGRIENMFAALQNVVPSHLMDAKLHGFKDLKITGIESDDGDKAFDEETFSEPGLPGIQVVSM